DGMDLQFASCSFTFATVCMSMMDMGDSGSGLSEAGRVLRPGGFLPFSILHPCFVPPHRRVLREPDGTTRAIEIGGYFDATDGRIETFQFENVPEEERQNGGAVPCSPVSPDVERVGPPHRQGRAGHRTLWRTACQR